MRSVYGDHERFVQTYFSTYKGTYFTGDGCRRDEDGYYWITGRVDDVINVSGHRLGTAEVELALVSHPKVAEAAVVGYPHDIKGQGIYCYVTLICRQSAERGVAQGTGGARAQGDRAAGHARPHPVLAGICPRRARARSCAASCARSPRTISPISATPRRWPSPPWWTTSSTTARTRRGCGGIGIRCVPGSLRGARRQAMRRKCGRLRYFSCSSRTCARTTPRSRALKYSDLALVTSAATPRVPHAASMLGS